MADPPFDFDEANPADNALMSQFPANERASRDNIQDAFEVEHTEAGGRHRIGIGSTTARNAITDWVVGSIWINTSLTPTQLQYVSSIGPVVFTGLADITVGPITTRGDLITGDASGDEQRLAIGASGRFLRSNGVDPLWVAIVAGDLPSASVAAKGIIEIATVAEQEAGTDTTRATTPGRQHRHISAAKVWGRVDRGGGTPTLQSPSYNITSVTDDGNANTIVTIGVNFSSAIYAILANATTQSLMATPHTIVAGAFDVTVINSAGGGQDTADFSCLAFGDQ